MIKMSDHSIIKDQRPIPKQVFIDKRNLYDLEAKAWIRGVSIAKDFNPTERIQIAAKIDDIIEILDEHIKNMED